jgi:hypothetical protein
MLHSTAAGIAEAHYQHRTPQDANGWNFVPKRDLTR